MDFVIIFHDGGKKWITQQQAIAISEAMDNPTNKFIDIGSEVKIAVSSISKILSENEYNRQYPEEELSPIIRNSQNDYLQLVEPKIDYEYVNIEKKAMKHKEQLQQIINGINKFIELNPDSPKAIQLKKKMEIGLKKFEAEI